VRLMTRVLVGLSFMAVVCSCWSMFDLSVTQAKLSATPIVIFGFSNESASAGVKSNLSQVVASDLSHSGDFHVTYPAPEGAPGPLSQATLQHWRQQRVNYLVNGNVTDVVGGRYRVSFKLFDVWAKPSAGSSTSSNTILSQSFVSTLAGMRLTAHRISDAIFQKLTGVRGIFATKIAYITVQNLATPQVSYQLNIADQDGYNEQMLLKSAEPIMSPAWSPDGAKIAYVSFEGKHAAIYIQDIATGKRRVVSDYPGINGSPSFSPDGKRLALVLSKTGHSDIYIMDIKTEALQQITKGYSINTEPAWAPDGQSIVFTSSRGGTPQIYRYNFSSHLTDRLTFDGAYNARASFVGREGKIVMMHKNNGLYGIAFQDLTNSRVDVLSQSGYDESPSVSPNGKMVIYASQYGGRGVLSMVSLDGKVKIRLPSNQGAVQSPVWSPFLG
jgi:TolB protein